jgi:hypothetical protein
MTIETNTMGNSTFKTSLADITGLYAPNQHNGWGDPGYSHSFNIKDYMDNSTKKIQDYMDLMKRTDDETIKLKLKELIILTIESLYPKTK